MSYFLATLALTLVITYWAARRSTGRSAMYCASASLTATQNGLAIAGDFLSANTLLGMVALYSANGIDSLIYYCTPLAGLYAMLRFVAGPLRRLGQFTLADVVRSRFSDERIRLLLGAISSVISLIYQVAQLVGAGALMTLLFRLPFNSGVIIVSVLTLTYVVFGGMLAATWVQIIKAALLLIVILVLSVLAVLEAGSPSALYAGVDRISAGALLKFGGMHLDAFSTLSLIMGLTLGMLGLPHLLVRLFTVRDERAARRSVAIATCVIGVSFGLMFAVVSPASVVLVKNAINGEVSGGPNMITLHLAAALGGPPLFGFATAVAFATILAVLAGLTVTISTALAHDVCPIFARRRPLNERGELVAFRVGAVLSTSVAAALAVTFQHENLAFLVSMAFAVAASSTFPMLILTLYWRRLTMEGVIAGGLCGLVLSVALIIAGPACWVRAFGFSHALFPSDYPALVTVPMAFATAWLVSHRTGHLVLAA